MKKHSKLFVIIGYSMFVLYCVIVIIYVNVDKRRLQGYDVNLLPEPVEITESKPLSTTEEPTIEITEEESKYLGEFYLTAYCSCEICCGEWASNRPLDENGYPIVYGASGMVLVPGTSIGVDPNVIPYGTIVEINGREYIASDTGGAISGNRIDVYHGSHESALRFNVGYYDVYLKGSVPWGSD